MRLIGTHVGVCAFSLLFFFCRILSLQDWGCEGAGTHPFPFVLFCFVCRYQWLNESYYGFYQSPANYDGSSLFYGWRTKKVRAPFATQRCLWEPCYWWWVDIWGYPYDRTSINIFCDFSQDCLQQEPWVRRLFWNRVFCKYFCGNALKDWMCTRSLICMLGSLLTLARVPTCQTNSPSFASGLSGYRGRAKIFWSYWTTLRASSSILTVL